jgi:hypothetical protein
MPHRHRAEADLPAVTAPTETAPFATAPFAGAPDAMTGAGGDSNSNGAFAALAHTLWRQQRLLELLLCRVEVQQLVLAAGRAHWIERAAADIDEAGEALGEEELVRSVQLAVLGNRLGIGSQPSLSELADAAPEPWGEIFHDHYRTFLDLVTKVRHTAKANHELAQRSLRTMNEVLDGPGAAAEPVLSAYGRPSPGGRPAAGGPLGANGFGGRPGPLLLDRKA